MMKLLVILFSLLMHAVCGQDGFCNMCEGSEDGTPSNTVLIVPFLAIGDNDNPTCQEVYDFARKSVTTSDDICSLIKSHKDFCGCPGASTTPLNSCSLCAEGATPLNLNAVTPFEDTCSELDTYLKYLPASVCLTERVGSIMRSDAFCGCPGVEAECYMCDGKDNKLSNPERMVPFYEFLGTNFASTCQDLADFYTLYDTDDPEISTCEFVQMESSYCGCESSADTSPVNACKLCSDGNSIGSPDKYIAELQMTCGELELYLSHVPADQCQMPWVVDFMRFDFFCGCASATAPCPMCPDGSIDITNPAAIIPYLIIPNNENPTCQQLATLGVIAEPGELVLDDCSTFENQANFCGCPGASKPEEACEFCPGGGDPPNPDLVTPFGDTCKELGDYLSFLPADQCDSDRIDFIKRQDFLCGCPTATTNCALCGNDGSNKVEFVDRHIPLLSLPLNTNPTCGEVVEFMAVNDGDLSGSGCTALQEYQGYCGCPSVPSINACSFCPNGGSPSNLEKVVSDVFTCQALQDFVSFLPGDECGTNSSDFEQIQAFAYVCGCPDTQPSCTLCPGGIDPPSASKLIGDRDGTTCGEYAEYVASQTSEQCAGRSAEIQSTASVCGCEGVIAPISTDTASDTASNTASATSTGQCTIQQNAELCTLQLLNSVEEKCDCYSFCDSKFVKCQGSEGGLMPSSECSGTPITGCNRAGVFSATKPRPVADDDYIRPAAQKADKSSQTSNVTVIIAIIVPVVLALLVLVYYIFTRKPTQKDLKIDAEIDGDDDVAASPLPVQAMEGSLSMADVTLSSPSSVSSPPPESFSIDDNEPPETNAR